MGKWNRWGRTLSVVVLAAAVVCGCGVKETLLSGRKSEREYGKAETMVIVTTERLRYEELYTDKIWDVAVDESGTTFEETLVNQIHDFLKELKTMSRMADEENVTLSGKERELVKQAAAQYMENLKNAGDRTVPHSPVPGVLEHSICEGLPYEAPEGLFQIIYTI